LTGHELVKTLAQAMPYVQKVLSEERSQPGVLDPL
jgi:hypothetical protein